MATLETLHDIEIHSQGYMAGYAEGCKTAEGLRVQNVDLLAKNKELEERVFDLEASLNAWKYGL